MTRKILIGIIVCWSLVVFAGACTELWIVWGPRRDCEAWPDDGPGYEIMDRDDDGNDDTIRIFDTGKPVHDPTPRKKPLMPLDDPDSI